MGKEHKMDCVNHSGINATAYCQSCGKALCAGCVRNATGGQLLCEPCLTAWQSYQQPFIPPPASGPNPAAAAWLGLIPGVGAMYNSQFLKGFIHVIVFAVLVSIANHYDIFGIFVMAWIFYQSFEAYQTAKALRDGLPPPDPLGLNEVGNWLNLGTRPPNSVPPAAGQGTAGYQPPPPYQAPFPPQPAGSVDPAAPPVSPAPPQYWRPLFWPRREPVGAIVLIALGVLFLLGQLDVFHDRFFGLIWPLLLIALGIWLIIRRFEDSRGGSK
jgi:TM2 domain-containing membrane protein YozV